MPIERRQGKQEDSPNMSNRQWWKEKLKKIAQEFNRNKEEEKEEEKLLEKRNDSYFGLLYSANFTVNKTSTNSPLKTNGLREFIRDTIDSLNLPGNNINSRRSKIIQILSEFYSVSHNGWILASINLPDSGISESEKITFRIDFYIVPSKYWKEIPTVKELLSKGSKGLQNLTIEDILDFTISV